MAQTESVFIGLGSNLGDSAQILLEGWRIIGEHRSVTLQTLSRPYLSSPVGMSSNFWFTNAVGQVQAFCDAGELLDILLAAEKRLGRTRDDKKLGYQDRKIDLDLLYFGSAMLDTPRLTVPHPYRNERLFVLAPMAEIAADYLDPETGSSIADLHRQLLQRIESGAVDSQEISPGAWPRQG